MYTPNTDGSSIRIVELLSGNSIYPSRMLFPSDGYSEMLFPLTAHLLTSVDKIPVHSMSYTY